MKPRHHASCIIRDQCRWNSVRFEYCFSEICFRGIRKSSDNEEVIAHYCGTTRAVFCGSIMMCAHGFPGYMIHGPPSTGLPLMPVDAGVAYGMYTTYRYDAPFTAPVDASTLSRDAKY